MFTWICPQCGREVPPSYTECPDCTEKQKSAAAAQSAAGSAAPPPAANAAAPAQPAPPPAKAARPASKSSLPGWLLSILFALVFIALALSFVTYYQSRKSQPKAIESTAAAGAVPAAPGGKQSSVAKFIEVTGFRVSEDAKQKAQVDFIIVNHSQADIAGLAGTVALQASASNSAQEAVATFAFKLKSLGPYEAKSLKIPIKTKLRAYELPDWQFLKADVQITSPE